jgi:glycosyltransferase involved in cell wall biosynthesis
MTRILALGNMYPPHHLGGYELSCRDVMDRFRARGHDVAVLTTTMRLQGVADPADDRTNQVHRELTFYWQDHELVRPALRRRLAIERANQRTIASVIDRFRPDVVSAWNMGAMSLGLLTQVSERGIPLVLNVCDEWPWYGPSIDAWSRLFLKRPALGRVVRRLTGVPTVLADLGATATFCFVSEAMRRSAVEKSAWRPTTSTVVYSGIDRADFPVEDPTTRPWSWRLLSVGRLDERKGVHVAIEALARLPAEATLDILGRGDAPYRARLEARARDLGLAGRVRFDVAPRHDLRERYRRACAVVFPTLWDEPFGLVPVEAMACDTPVVATATGGSQEFLFDGVNIVKVPVGDPAALAHGLERLAGDPALRARLVEAGRRTAAELTTDRLSDVLEAWHLAAAERFANGRPADRPSMRDLLAVASPAADGR